MGNAEAKNNVLQDVDLYKNQARYETYVNKKMMVYKILFLISSILSLVSMFAIPMYKYASLGKKKGQLKVVGEYTPVYIIQKYFGNTLGPHVMLNTGLVICIVVMIVLSVMLVIGAVLNMFAKNLVDSNKNIGKIFGYGMLEVLATLLFVVLILSMICAKVHLSGKVENITGFWIVFVSSIVMTCTSIPLSSK
jgi:hypothetical protein